MSLRPLNSVGGFSVGETPSNIILANGDITTTAITVSGKSNLGPSGNVIITGGTSGYYLQTDGQGNLTWAAVPTGTGISNGTSNVNIPSINGNVNTSVGGNANVFVVTGTGVNVSGTLNATGNANVGNIGAEFGVFTNVSGNGSTLSSITGANVTGQVGYAAVANSVAGANVSGQVSYAAVANSVAGANVSGQVSNALVAGTVYTNAQPNITSVGVLNELLVANTILADGYAARTGDDLPISTSGNGNLVITTAGTGITNFSNKPVSNISVLTVNANVVSGNVYANSGIIAAQTLKGEGGNISNIQGANVNGTVSSATSAGTAGTAGTVTTAAQPNITSVGTLTGLTVSGVTNLGPNGNVIITGGTNGQFLQTNGSGNLSWTTIVTSGITNGTSNINIPVADGNVNTSVGGNANVFVVTGTGVNVAGTLNATGNIDGGNITSANIYVSTLGTGQVAIGSSGGKLVGGPDLLWSFANAELYATGFVSNRYVTADGNITGGNLTTGGALSVTGNANVGNLGTSGLIVATGNVTGGNLVTGGALSVTGNANLGNLGTAQVLASANITTPVFISNVSTGTAPLTVSSTTKVVNLNADLLDGYDTAISATASSVVVRDANANINANNISGTLTTAAQTNITAVGTLGSLSVTANVTAGNVYANSGTIGASLLTGTLTTAAQPNVTSVGTLTTLTVSGNANVGNIGANNAVFTGTGAFGGNVDMGNFNITNLAEPNAASDAATKSYVDAAVTGLHVHAACYVATTGTLAAASGGTTTYNTPGAGQVGAYISTTGTFLLIDGGNVQTVGTRILVKNEANAAWNGIYTYANTTALVRATDFDTNAEAAGGDFTFVQSGSTQADTGWVQTTDNPTLGTSPIVFTQFSGAGTYQAGTGLTLTGTVFSITDTTVTAGSYGNGDSVATFTVNGQGQLTAASNVAITANAANLSGTTLATGITTSSLTTVGTLGSLTVSGNATVGNLIGVLANGNSNVSIPSANGNVGISVNGMANVLLVTSTGANIGGTLNTGVGNANLGNLGTAQVLASANITTPQFISNVGTGTAPLVVTSTTRVANLNVATAGVANTVADAAQPNVTSVGTLTGLDVNGNITAANITANTGVFTGNGNGLSSLQGANVVGTLNSTTLGNSTLYVGTTAIALNRGSASQSLTGITSIDGYASTVSTAAQPNITSVGTLTSLTVSGNTTSGNFIGTLANTTSNVAIPTAGGNVNITAGGTTSLVVTSSGANVTGTFNSTGTATVGNVSTAGNIVAANLTANTKVVIGNTVINWAQVTTTATTANQAISSVAVDGITGVQWLVRGADSTGAKYTVATVNAVTDGANVDWSVYGGVTLGSTTGTLSVAISASNIVLQVTPSSSNSTVWVTQYKYI